MALGNFDGFHLGHQRVAADRGRLGAGRGAAGRLSPPSIRIRCVTSLPHVPPFRLTSARPARRAVRRCGRRCDARLRLRRGELAAMPADAFVQRPPRRIGSARAGVVTGEDFTFGQPARRQCRRCCAKTGAQCGIETRAVGPVMEERSGGLLEPYPRRAQGRRLRHRRAPAHPPLRDARHRPARRQARARDRLPDCEYRARLVPAPAFRDLCGDRDG